ncbi:hypothetical protein D9M72_482710 [compost metagenome]
MTQQERLKLLARLFQRIAGCLASPHQVADRLMSFIWNPDRGQLARAVQARQADSIPAVGLHPVARSLGHQRRCHHHAVMPQLDNLTVKAVTRGTSLIAEVKLGSALG